MGRLEPVYPEQRAGEAAGLPAGWLHGDLLDAGSGQESICAAVLTSCRALMSHVAASWPSPQGTGCLAFLLDSVGMHVCCMTELSGLLAAVDRQARCYSMRRGDGVALCVMDTSVVLAAAVLLALACMPSEPLLQC
jgi:hypothetical protein